MKLEGKEEEFCLFYREFGNGKKAALAAGYPARNAEVAALTLWRINEFKGDLPSCEKAIRVAGRMKLLQGLNNSPLVLLTMRYSWRYWERKIHRLN